MSKTVVVTGANGFIASHVVQQLLLEGYHVRGTVRDPSNEEKVGHLKRMAGAQERLTLHQVGDLTQSELFDDVVRDAYAVLHTASPLLMTADDPEEQILKPAVQGTRSVLDSIQRSGDSVRVLVVTSSIAAISINGGALASDHVYSEADWSPDDVLRAKKWWYPLSKTLAERAVWDHPLVKEGKVRTVTIQPGYVTGPLLNARHALGTMERYVKACKGELWGDGVPAKDTVMVDVRDVARAHVNSVKKDSAEGRHGMVSRTIPIVDVVKAMRAADPSLPLNDSIDGSAGSGTGDLWDCSKAEALVDGWTSLQDTATHSVQSFKDLGVL